MSYPFKSIAIQLMYRRMSVTCNNRPYRLIDIWAWGKEVLREQRKYCTIGLGLPKQGGGTVCWVVGGRQKGEPASCMTAENNDSRWCEKSYGAFLQHCSEVGVNELF